MPRDEEDEGEDTSRPNATQSTVPTTQRATRGVRGGASRGRGRGRRGGVGQPPLAGVEGAGGGDTSEPNATQSTLPTTQRATRGGRGGAGRGRGRGRRGGVGQPPLAGGEGVEGADSIQYTPTPATQPRRLRRKEDRRTVAERYDQADAEHDTGYPEGLMSVDISDWAMVMEALEHIQCQQTNRLLKDKTVESLWEKKGLDRGEN